VERKQLQIQGHCWKNRKERKAGQRLEKEGDRESEGYETSRRGSRKGNWGIMGVLPNPLWV